MIQEKKWDKISKMVAESYNIIGGNYHATRIIDKFNSELRRFSELLPKNARVLDAGSGSGVPTSKYLSEKGLRVTGIDISDGMLEEARRNVPDAEFKKMNMRELQFSDAYFDGIISVFAVFHVPREFHEDVFSEFHRTLKKGGILMINQSVREMNGISRFFGEPMMWSNHHPQDTLQMIKDRGFEIVFEGNLVRGGEIQYWILARKV